MRGFSLALLVLLLIAAYLHIEFFFTVVYFFAAILLLSRFWLQRSIKQLHLERRLLERAFTGDEVQVELRLRNDGWLPVPWLALGERVPVELAGAPPRGQVVSLGGRERWSHSYSFRALKRGYYTLGPLRAQMGDLLGIEGVDLEVGGEDRIIIYPRVLSLPELGLPTRSPQAVLSAQSYLFEDPSRITGVRDYQRGDAPRRLHWPATARTGNLMVKQYQPAIARETMICLDLDEENYDLNRRYEATELAIVVAASLATHIVSRERLAVGLTTEALDPLGGGRRLISLLPRSEQTHLLGNLLEVLARVQLTGGTHFAALLRHAVTSLSWGGTVIAITGRESTDLLPGLLSLRRSGFAVTLLLVQPSDLTPQLRQQATAVGIATRRVWADGQRVTRGT